MSTQTEPSTPEDAIRVLHVDDEHSPLEFTKSFVELSDRNIHMESVATAEEALRRLEEENFDCVVSDYQMPVLNGIDLAKRIRGFSDVPIIIYTGRGSEEVAEAAFTVGIDDYIRKELNPSHYQVLARRIRSVVEERRGHDALIRSEERYRTLIEQLPDPVSVRVGDERVYVSKSAAEFWGYDDVSELLGVGGAEVIAPEDWPIIVERMERRERGEELPSMYEVKIRKTDGSTVDAEVHTTSIDYQGTPAILNIMRDITDRKRMEEELRISRERLQTFMNSAPINFAIFDSELNYIDVNQNAAKLFGMSREELIGRNMIEAHPYTGESGRDELYREVIRTGEPLFLPDVSAPNVHGDRVTSIWGFKVGEGLGLVSLDVTDRTKAEEALKTSEEKYRSLFENMLNGFAYCKIVLNEDNRPVDFVYIEINDAFEALTGLKREEVVGKKVSEAIPRIIEDHPELFEVYGQVALTGKEDRLEIFFKPLEIWLDISVYSPEKGCFVAVFENVTERKRMEEELRSSDSRLRSIAMNSPDHIILLDTDANIQFINYTVPDLTPEQVIGTSIYDYVPEEFLQTNKECYERVLKTGEPDRYNTEYTIDGQIHTFENSVGPVKQGEDVVGLIVNARDITERMKSEKELRRSEERYRTLIEEGMDAVAITIEQEFAYVNKTFVEMLGYADPSELIGRRSGELVDPRDRERLGEITERRKRGEKQRIIYGLRILKKDGSSIWLEVSSIGTEFGGKRASISNSRDITDRKKIETELQDSEERWRSLVELAPDGIMTVDLKGYITSINDAFVKLTGFSREEIVGKHFTRMGTMRVRDIPIYVKLFASLLKGDIPPSYEFIYRRKDGSEGWAETQIRLIETTEKKKELLAVVSDVSERKRMEEELKQHSEHLEELIQKKTMELSVSEERLRSFMASAPDAFTLYDSELNCLDVNQAVLKYWPEGTRKEDLIGRNMLDLSPYVKETGRYDRYLEVIKTGKPFQLEDPPAHPFLGEARLSLRAFKVGEGLGIITTDITERKRLEQELVEAERISAMGRVSAMMGHDLRGPLQSIMNALYIMEKTPEKAGELRGKIEDSVNYATRILDDLRYSTGDVPVDLQESNIGDLLQKAVANSPMPENIEVGMDVGEGLTSVRLDPLMIQRIIDNLIRNSVEAMEDGGVLSLTAFKEPEWVVIKVSDTGTGIPEEDLKHMFTLFFTSKPGGTGLGLAYCKRAVEAHGGTIKVESEVDRRTTFTMRIPMNHEHGKKDQT